MGSYIAMKPAMSTNHHFGMPGPGGSLGKCALCGNVFLKEILLGQAVQSFTVDGCNQTLYGHKDCLTQYAGKKFDAIELPEASPLRQAYEKVRLEHARDAVDNYTLNGGLCPNDTDGDGDCGRPMCPVCGTRRQNV